MFGAGKKKIDFCKARQEWTGCKINTEKKVMRNRKSNTKQDRHLL